LEYLKSEVLLVFVIYYAAINGYTAPGSTMIYWIFSKQAAPMTPSRWQYLQRLWRNIHLCVGVGISLLLVAIGLSGSLLVWHDRLDALIHPARYSVGDGPARPASDHLAAAGAAVGTEFQPFVVRFPDSAPSPVTVSARGTSREGGARPRILTVYLDPATARVFDVVDFRSSFIGILHRFHENLTVPEYNGRDIVGWAGVAMLTMSLTGLYLWWPRGGRWVRGFRWRRGPGILSNLHHVLGVWISVPLAVVSLTGIYLGFPAQGRAVLSSFAAMTPQQRGGFGAPLSRQTRLSSDQALDAALAAVPDGQPAAIFLPTRQSQAWRVQLRQGEGDARVTVLVDDRSGTTTARQPLAGDRVAAWIRWIHEGSRGGAIWQVVVFLCGIFPLVFAVTGTAIWLQRRARRAANARMPAIEASQLGAAE
jgi:uncharacterized iron-regulated membrane protein